MRTRVQQVKPGAIVAHVIFRFLGLVSTVGDVDKLCPSLLPHLKFALEEFILDAHPRLVHGKLTFLLELCGGKLAVSQLGLENLALQNSLHLSNVIFNRR